MSSILLKTEDAIYSILNAQETLGSMPIHRSGDQDKLVMPCINVTAETSEERPFRGLGNYMVTVNIELHTSFDDTTRDERIILNDALIDLLDDDDIVSVMTDAATDYRVFGVLRDSQVQKITNRAHIYGFSFKVICCNSDAEETPEEGDDETSSEANAPIFHTNIVNSKAAVLFDGIDDHLHIVNAAGNQCLGNWNLLIVLSLLGDGLGSVNSENPPIVQEGNGGGGAFIWTVSDTTDDKLNITTNTEDNYVDNQTVPLPSDGTFKIFTGQYDGDNVTLRINGVTQSNDQSNDPGGNLVATTGVIRLGGYINQFSNTTYFKGYIAEVILFNTALADVDRNYLESHLKDKYGLGSGTAMTDGAILALAPAVWLDADSMSLSDGDGVGLWHDKAGSNFDAIV